MIVSNVYNKDGEERVITKSDMGMMVERDGKLYSSADDLVSQNREYTETAIPIEDDRELTLNDALEMLSELGVDINDEE